MEVLSMADFTDCNNKFDYEYFPATKFANGYQVILHHGDTLCMPAGF